MGVSFKREELNEAGEWIGPVWVSDWDDLDPKPVKMGDWTTEAEAKKFAEAMGYEFDLA